MLGCAAVLSGMSLHGYAQQPFMVDEVVAVVGNSPILYSEIDQMAKQLVQQRRQMGYTSDRNPESEALEQLLLQKLLFNQAQIDSVEVQINDIPQMVEDEVHRMVEQQGSLLALEAMYHMPIFEIKRNLQTRLEEMRYAQRMQAEVQSKVTITPGEVDRYYRKIDKDSLPIIPEQVVYAQIFKYPNSTKEAKQRVRERLLELRERILKGESFEMLARVYSVDGSARQGGELDPMSKESFVVPFGNALEKLRPGQISEVVETEYGFHLIQLIDKKGNLYHCRHILLRPVFMDQELTETTEQLDSVVRLVRLDSLTFEKAAMDFSDDKYSKLNGGIVSNYEMLELSNRYNEQPTTRFIREELMPTDSRILATLKVGEISDAFETQDLRGNLGSKVLKLVEVIPAHSASMKDDYLRLEQLALQQKQDVEFRKWLDEKIAGMYIRIEPQYRYDDFENKAWLKK